MPTRMFDRKSAHERGIFREFAERWRPDVDMDSITSGNPVSREPDILAKSTESDLLIAVELVRLTEPDSQALANMNFASSLNAASVARYNVHAFAEKFQNSRRGYYEGVPALQLELLAYSDLLATPWNAVLDTLRDWLLRDAGPTDFTQVWLWNRPDTQGEKTELWRWTPHGGLQLAG